MLEIENLECIRGDRRLFSGLDMTLDGGELLYVHGHNGSGKTTLLRTVCGLVAPSAGQVRWGGRDIRRLREEEEGDPLRLELEAELVEAGRRCLCAAVAADEDEGLVAARVVGLDALQRVQDGACAKSRPTISPSISCSRSRP